VEHEYVVHVEDPSGGYDRTHKTERPLVELEVINLGGQQLVIREIVSAPGIGTAGHATAEPFHQVHAFEA
jgi:hypothetical protein